MITSTDDNACQAHLDPLGVSHLHLSIPCPHYSVLLHATMATASLALLKVITCSTQQLLIIGWPHTVHVTTMSTWLYWWSTGWPSGKHTNQLHKKFITMFDVLVKNYCIWSGIMDDMVDWWYEIGDKQGWSKWGLDCLPLHVSGITNTRHIWLD